MRIIRLTKDKDKPSSIITKNSKTAVLIVPEDDADLERLEAKPFKMSCVNAAKSNGAKRSRSRKRSLGDDSRGWFDCCTIQV